MKLSILQKDKAVIRRGIVLRVFSGAVITSMVIPIVIVDVFCSFYHAVFFRLNGIPLIPRDKYIVIDRGRLHKLNWVQRWNCVYCDYANGLIAWAKAVINTTEVYSCAIKHASVAYGQEHQKDYFNYDGFR